MEVTEPKPSVEEPDSRTKVDKIFFISGYLSIYLSYLCLSVCLSFIFLSIYIIYHLFSCLSVSLSLHTLLSIS